MRQSNDFSNIWRRANEAERPAVLALWLASLEADPHNAFTEEYAAYCGGLTIEDALSERSQAFGCHADEYAAYSLCEMGSTADFGAFGNSDGLGAFISSAMRIAADFGAFFDLPECINVTRLYIAVRAEAMRYAERPETPTADLSENVPKYGTSNGGGKVAGVGADLIGLTSSDNVRTSSQDTPEESQKVAYFQSVEAWTDKIPPEIDGLKLRHNLETAEACGLIDHSGRWLGPKTDAAIFARMSWDGEDWERIPWRPFENLLQVDRLAHRYYRFEGAKGRPESRAIMAILSG